MCSRRARSVAETGQPGARPDRPGWRFSCPASARAASFCRAVNAGVIDGCPQESQWAPKSTTADDGPDRMRYARARLEHYPI